MARQEAKTAAEFGSDGGTARAKRLTAEQRTSIARQAAVARWNKSVPHATNEGPLTIGGITIPCAVLEDGTRVLSRIGFIRAIGRRGKAKGGRRYDAESKVPVFVTADNLKPFVDNELLENSRPIMFRPAAGGVAMGYRAELLPQVCNVFLDAKDAGVLRSNQVHIADRCRILSRGFAVVGITALVDEATGYQDLRARNALAEILEAFVAKELRKWVKTFPLEFYRELCRLREVPFPAESLQLPSYFGHLTNDIVYSRLAPGVLAELKKKNPVVKKGYRRHKHFQWLTDDIGDPKLRQHLWNAITLMKASDSYAQFKAMLDRALPQYSTLPLLAISENSGDASDSIGPSPQP